jgi:hypothetical protein
MAKPRWTTLDQLAMPVGARPPDNGHRTTGSLSRRRDGKALILNVSLSTLLRVEGEEGLVALKSGDST